MKLQTLALTSALLLSGIGCEEQNPQRVPTTVETVAAEYNYQGSDPTLQYFDSVPAHQNTHEKKDGRATLVGRIVKVQPSQFSYVNEKENKTYAASREFIYVMVEDVNQVLHTFIYPHSKAIIERDATITYRPLFERVSADDFVRAFIRGYSWEHFQASPGQTTIEAEGIILPKGIQYKTNAEKE